jgi:hypothetical protein
MSISCFPIRGTGKLLIWESCSEICFSKSQESSGKNSGGHLGSGAAKSDASPDTGVTTCRRYTPAAALTSVDTQRVVAPATRRARKYYLWVESHLRPPSQTWTDIGGVDRCPPSGIRRRNWDNELSRPFTAVYREKFRAKIVSITDLSGQFSFFMIGP